MSKKESEYIDYIPPKWKVRLVKEGKSLINRTFKKKNLAIEAIDKALNKHNKSKKEEPIMDFNY